MLFHWAARCRHGFEQLVECIGGAWEKQVLSARGFKRVHVGIRSEYAMYMVWRCVRRGHGRGFKKGPRGFK
jgi:hypothetical protein